MTNIDFEILREKFIEYLLVDNGTDARRKDFNQAIFIKSSGRQVFNGTDFDMIMEKFDKAVKMCKNKDDSK